MSSTASDENTDKFTKLHIELENLKRVASLYFWTATYYKESRRHTECEIEYLQKTYKLCELCFKYHENEKNIKICCIDERIKNNLDDNKYVCRVCGNILSSAVNALECCGEYHKCNVCESKYYDAERANNCCKNLYKCVNCNLTHCNKNVAALCNCIADKYTCSLCNNEHVKKNKIYYDAKP